MGHAHSIKEYPGQLAGIAMLSAAVGAVTAMLLTPKRGEELRHGIGSKARQGKDTLMDKVHSTQAAIGDSAQEIKEQAKDRTADMAEKSKQAADKAKDKSDR